jgi:hypothetical protein
MRLDAIEQLGEPQDACALAGSVRRQIVEELDRDDGNNGECSYDDCRADSVHQGQDVGPPAAQFETTTQQSAGEAEGSPIERCVDDSEQAQEEK